MKLEYTLAPGSQRGKVAIVTGANTGIGRATARELAGAGAHVFLACRSDEKTAPVVAQIRAESQNELVEWLPLDLADLRSVRASAETFLARALPLHILINNAGLAGRRGLTRDGFELQFGVNHLGPFSFTEALLPCLLRSAPARIVNVSSRAHYSAKAVDVGAFRSPTKTVTAMREYSVSKLANILYTKELAERLAGTGVTTYALHPGVVASDIWRRVPQPFRWFMTRKMVTNEEGAATSLYCATAEACQNETGLYYEGCTVREPSPLAEAPSVRHALIAQSRVWAAI